MESTLSDLSGVPDTTFAGALKQTITDNLSAHNRIDSTNDTLRKASVGIIVVENDKGEAGFILCEPGEAINEAINLAERINSNAPLAVRATRKAVLEGAMVDDDEGIRIAVELFAPVAKSEDAKEGPLAFVEKRSPEWKAR